MANTRFSYWQGISLVIASLVYGIVAAALSLVWASRWGLYAVLFAWLVLLLLAGWQLQKRVRSWGLWALCMLAAIIGGPLAFAVLVMGRRPL